MISSGTPRNFLGITDPDLYGKHAETRILPVPYETTTSWQTGTRDGPRAIIDASHQISTFDHELSCDITRKGIHTMPPLELPMGNAAEAMSQLGHVYRDVMAALCGRRLIMIGGEHSISAPAILSWAAKLDEPLTVLQFDAHLDLFEKWAGTRFSHASVMHRILDKVNLVTVGARNIAEEEWNTARDSENVTVFTDLDIEGADMINHVASAIPAGNPVYITFDVDFFDSAIMPATGIPEPGGGTWRQAISLLRWIFRNHQVVAIDVVEHMPIPGFAAPDLTTAKLIAKMIGYWSVA